MSAPHHIALKEAVKNLDLSEQFVQLIHLLPFIDPTSIINDTAKGRAFLIELHNVMRLHSIIEYSKTGVVRDIDPKMKTLGFFMVYRITSRG